MTLDAFPETAVQLFADGDERFTTREVLEWCKQRCGVDAFDLDVAACDEAHCAPSYYTKQSNGLSQPWWGRVWCNPPYSDIEPWVAKADAEISRKDGPELIAMLVPATRTEQPWWHRWIEKQRDSELYKHPSLSTHFLPGRTNFARPGSNGVAQKGSPFGTVLLVWSRT